MGTTYQSSYGVGTAGMFRGNRVEKDFSSRRYLNRTCSVEVKETEVSTSGGAAHLAQSPKLCTRTYGQGLFAIMADPRRGWRSIISWL